MKAFGTADMQEATRLTRAGRLREATALLQAGLGFPRGSSSAPDHDDRPLLEFERAGTGNSAWRMPDGPTTRARGTSSPAWDGIQRMPLNLKRADGLGRHARGPSISPGASFETLLVANAAGRLDYKLYAPSKHDQRLVPLVVMLHGCTQNPDDFAAGTRMNELAELYGFFVAYPAQTKAANASRCWNWFKDSQQRRDQGEPSLVADATRQILSQHPIDPRRVFVAGLSAGGAAAAILGCTYPDIYAGVGVHSGLACGAASDLPSAFQAMRSGPGRRTRPTSDVPTIVFHGAADRTVGPSNADAVVDQVVIESGAVTTERGTTSAGLQFVRTVRHAESGQATSEQWMVEGAGHAWFGGDRKGSYTDPRGPDASREMLRFFGIVPREVDGN